MISLFSLGKHFSVLELELQAEEMGRWENMDQIQRRQRLLEKE